MDVVLILDVIKHSSFWLSLPIRVDRIIQFWDSKNVRSHSCWLLPLGSSKRRCSVPEKSQHVGQVL